MDHGVVKPTITTDILLVDITTTQLRIDLDWLRGWLRGTVVERRSLAGELSLSCARPVADG